MTDRTGFPINSLFAFCHRPRRHLKPGDISTSEIFKWPINNVDLGHPKWTWGHESVCVCSKRTPSHTTTNTRDYANVPFLRATTTNYFLIHLWCSWDADKRGCGARRSREICPTSSSRTTKIHQRTIKRMQRCPLSIASVGVQPNRKGNQECSRERRTRNVLLYKVIPNQRRTVLLYVIQWGCVTWSANVQETLQGRKDLW